MIKKGIILLGIIGITFSPSILIFYLWGFPLSIQNIDNIQLFYLIIFIGIFVSSFGGGLFGIFLNSTILRVDKNEMKV